MTSAMFANIMKLDWLIGVRMTTGQLIIFTLDDSCHMY